jgi:cytochrome P450
MTKATDAITFTDPAVQVCPFPAYKSLFAEGKRVHRDPVTGFYEVLHHDDLMRIVKDPVLFSSEHMLYGERTHTPAYEETKRMTEEEGYPSIPTIINADGAVHRRNRDLVDVSFKASRVKQLEPYIRDLVGMLIGRWKARGETEFMTEFAELLPLYVIADAIGVTRDRALDFKRWSDALVGVTDPAITAERQIDLTRQVIDMHQFFAAEYEQAKADPQPGILGDIARGEIEGQPVTTQLAVHLLASVLVAGNETTTSSLGSAMKRMIEAPGMEDRLRAEPARIPDFIEEVLRLESPLPGMFRRNTEEVTIGDTTIPKDSLIVLRFGAGNRDDERYEEPEALNIDRPRIKQHLAFGGGIHMCIGHLLARAELRIAYEELLARFRNFRLAGEPHFEPDYVAYGPRRLQIAFDLI